MSFSTPFVLIGTFENCLIVCLTLDLPTWRHPFQTTCFQNFSVVYFINRCVSWPCLPARKGYVEISRSCLPDCEKRNRFLLRLHMLLHEAVHRRHVSAHVKALSQSFNNTLHHLDPDWISCQLLDVWAVVHRTLCSEANRPQLCVRVCACVWLIERSVCSVWFGLCGHVYELLFCAELITSDRGTHIYIVTNAHICICLYENPLNLQKCTSWQQLPNWS